MNKKVLSIVLVAIVIVAGVAYYGFQKSSLSTGIDKDSVMGMMKEKGDTVMDKAEYISKCKESDLDTQDMCYALGALYYRDASFCGLIKSAETKGNCNEEKIEEWYVTMKKTGATGFESLGGLTGQLPNAGDGISNGDEPSPADGDNEKPIDYYNSTKDITSLSSVANEVKTILGEACGAVKLKQVLKDPMSKADIFVYVWKEEPTAENLESSFVKNGYTIEMSGESLIVKKGDLAIAVSWVEEMASQEIGVTPFSDN
ncbi:MAG: hypothetical protein WAV11_00205 [Minisyncoccia bacterium]